MLIFTAFACEDSLSDVELNEAQAFEAISAKDKLAQTVAINLAGNVVDQGVRDFIKDQASNRFDGDDNFLLEVEKNEPVRFSSSDARAAATTFGQLLEENTAAPGNARVANSSALLDYISTLSPRLLGFTVKEQICVPLASMKNLNITNQCTT